ncbi:MAG: serine hydrolase domain-containing protein, partial [Bacteroidota bacterium]
WEGGGPISLNFKPGTAFGYSGEAFNYLGRVLEQITKKKLPQIFEEEVAGPFKLKNTFYHYADSQEKHTAIGHYHQYPSYKGKEYMPSPASSVVTNAHDFQKFVIGLLKEKHLSKKSYESLDTPQTVLEADQKIYDPDLPQYISHGFFVQETNKGKLLAHGGNNGDYDCKFAYNPDQKVGYIVLTNSNLGDEFSRKLEEFLFH